MTTHAPEKAAAISRLVEAARLLDEIARIIEPEAFAAFDADYAKTKHVTDAKMGAIRRMSDAREKALKIVALFSADRASQEDRIREDEPVMWRRRGKHRWLYRESPPTEQSGTGWCPLYDRPAHLQGGAS